MFGFRCHLRPLPGRRPWRKIDRECLTPVLKHIRDALARRPGAHPIAVNWHREMIALRIPTGDWRITLRPGALQYGEHIRRRDVVRFEVGAPYFNRRKALV